LAEKNTKVRLLKDIYTDLEKLGEGGSGTTFRAIKIENNAIVSKLPSHKNVLSYSSSRKLIYQNEEKIVLEGPYFDSQPLMNDQGHIILGLNYDDKIKIMHSIASALYHLHKNKKIHRDVKPTNVLLKLSKQNRVQQVKLIDYGISKTLSNEWLEGITSSHDFIGTERTSSPNALKSSRHCDPSDDIYSAGLTFFEILLGHKWTNDMTPAEKTNYQYNTEFEVLIKKQLKNIEPWLFELISFMTFKKNTERISEVSTIIEALENKRKSDWWIGLLEQTHKKWKVKLIGWEDRKITAECSKCGILYTYRGRELFNKMSSANLDWNDLTKNHYFPTNCLACVEEEEKYDNYSPPSFIYFPGKVKEITPDPSKFLHNKK